MKQTFFSLAIGFTTITAFAQEVKEADVPAAVKTTFSKQFPGTKGEKWEKENGNYEAEFDFYKVETSALFNASGSLLETEIKIKTGELPKIVTEYVEKYLPGKKIKEASKITDAKDVVTYEAEVDETDYIFDSAGNFLKKEVENNNDKNKD